MSWNMERLFSWPKVMGLYYSRFFISSLLVFSLLHLLGLELFPSLFCKVSVINWSLKVLCTVRHEILANLVGFKLQKHLIDFVGRFVCFTRSIRLVSETLWSE